MKNSKKTTYIALGAILIFSLLSGCAGSGGEPLKIQKADAQVQQLVTTASAQEAATIEAYPAKIEQTYTSDDGTMTLRINAVVEAPSVPLPSVRISPYRFTEEDAARIIAALSENGMLYADSKEHPSAERVREKIKNGTALLAAIQTHPEAFNQNSRLLSTGEFEKSIGALDDALLTAAPLSGFALADSGAVQSDEEIGSVSGGFLRNGHYYALSIANGEAGGTVICSRLRDDPVSLKLMQPYQLTYRDAGMDQKDIHYAEALALAEEVIRDIGAGDMALGTAVSVEYPNGMLPAYDQFQFARQVNGVSVGVDQALLAEDVYNSNVPEEAFTAAVPYESLVVRIDSEGLLRLEWIAPMMVTEQLTENTVLLPLEDILDCFGKMAWIKTDAKERLGWENDNGKVVSRVQTNVERICLFLMRVESGGGYLLIPVWDFYGYTELLDQDGSPFSFEATRKNSEYTEYGRKGESEYIATLKKTQAEKDYNRMLERQTSLITINAVDGTIIDRLTGY